MKYYLIAGEASGDLHASRLMRAIAGCDADAEFRFFGGDLMAEVGGRPVKHYRELAYMGFVPVLLHLPAILRNMKLCKRDILAWQPDVVILVDYAGFNLKIARFVRRNSRIPVHYYISPKIWAWKEYRIRNIKRDVKELYSILPFEVSFFEGKHNYKIHYVGNPTVEEVESFRSRYDETFGEFCARHELSGKPVIALLAGSRRQEIRSNLPAMIEAARHFEDYQLVVAGAPGVEAKFYEEFAEGAPVRVVSGETYQILANSTAALVTSGTATLETALFNVPQVVCYATSAPRLTRFAFEHIIKVRHISLVNLIADREVVAELLADRFRISNIANELYKILPLQPGRTAMLEGYRAMRSRLGSEIAPENAARLIVHSLNELHA